MATPALDCLSCKTPTEIAIMQLQYLEEILIASGGGDVGGSNVNINEIKGTATSVGCGAADAGTLRVAHATDCTVTSNATVVNGAGAAAVNIQDGGNTITVDGTVAIGSTVTPGTGASNLGKAEDSPAASGDVGVMALSVGNEAQNTLAADGDYIANAVDTKGNSIVVGNIASDGIDAGAPVKIGTIARTSLPTAVANADRVNLISNKYGELVTLHSLREERGNQVTTITSSTAETTIVTANATNFLDLYGLIVTNTSATAVNVAIKDATAGTTRINIAVPAGDTRGFMLPASDGHKQNAINNNWTATCSASVASVIITAFYKQNP